MQNLVSHFEAFLERIPLEKYRKDLLHIKIVEQDLPKDLNPLADIYSTYWVEEVKDLPDYEEFFEAWWQKHLKPIDEFIKKYFWGCSYEFVRLGFKARLYRTFISVLTQFHFCYSWKSFCSAPLKTSAELDMKGIDAVVEYEGCPVALQVKKETYRPEASGSGRFVRREWNVCMMIEIPYTITAPEDWKKQLERARREDTRRRYAQFLWLAENLQKWLENGFVVFQPTYPQLVEQYIAREKPILSSDATRIVPWDILLDSLRESL